jgi:hypothetical protein
LWFKAFSNFFNTLSDRLGPIGPAFFLIGGMIFPKPGRWVIRPSGQLRRESIFALKNDRQRAMITTWEIANIIA